MDTLTQKRQFRRFGLYGLFKNLRFFEPFLWIYFIMNGLTLFQIGLLYSIRELLIYLFEIPSGVIADRYGKKNELMICFVFYISSFVIFFFASNFGFFVIAMVLYGLGEAFRSGTHKAMIMEYLDYNQLGDSKSKVYGYTRSYSNIGSALSSILGIVLLIVTPEIRYLFLVAIIPYLIDILLISSYPKYLNKRIDHSFSLKQFLVENVNSVKYAFRNKRRSSILLNSSGYHAVFKTMKDYVQPMIVGTSTVVVFSVIATMEQDNKKVLLGLVYFVAYIISVFSSKYTYLLEKKIKKETLISVVWLIMSIVLLLLGFFSENLYIIIGLFILSYMLLNIRKPYVVEMIGEVTKGQKRASVLSIESQLTSLIIIVLAPLMGFIADTYSIGVMFIVLGSMMFLSQIFFQTKKSA